MQTLGDQILARLGMALYFMSYNFARVHQTPRVTAIEAGLADHVWAIEEIVARLW